MNLIKWGNHEPPSGETMNLRELAQQLWKEPLDRPKPPPKPRKTFMGLRPGDRLRCLKEAIPQGTVWVVHQCDSLGVTLVQEGRKVEIRHVGEWRDLFVRIPKARARPREAGPGEGPRIR